MLRVTINGTLHRFPEGMRLLDALHAVHVRVPALCDDPRLKPVGACRLCMVEVAGEPRPVVACTTPLRDGMEVFTHTAALEAWRRTNLHLLATRHGGHPTEGSARDLHPRPGGDVKHWSFGPAQPELVDASHPYLRVDMTRCIDCFRCVRICDEVQGQGVWRVWNRGDATRILPDSGTTLLESSCVSCGACADTCPTGALEDQSVLAWGNPVHWTRTTCPYCGVGCEMKVGTRAGRIVQVKPDLASPVNRGHLCVKGRYAFDFVHAADRITEPQLRVHGRWQTVPWDEALGYVAARLQDVVARHGADSVGILGSARGTNEENYVVQKFARLVLGTNNVDCCARVCHAPTAAAMKATLGTGAATNSFEDIEKTRGFLICGANITENHPVVGARILQAVRRGAKLIVLDPRRIGLAQSADLHLALRPGSNVPLLNAMACVLVEEGLVDASFLRDRVDGMEAFRAHIRGFSPEAVATMCGVPAEQIRAAARLYAATRPAMCFHGLGMTEHVQGTEGVMCLVNLALLTGNLGKPGAGVNPLRGQNNVQGSAHMGCEPDHLTGYVPILEAGDRFAAEWGGRVPRGRGLNLMEMMDAAMDGGLKALWTVGYDIALTNPNASATRAALSRLDLVVVQDLFMNEVGRLFGHVFLPACSAFEKDGTFMNSERRVQRVRQAVPPAGESKTDWEIVCAVARALGFGAAFAYASAEDIWDEIRSVWPAGAGMTYARLEQGGLQWPCPTLEHPGTSVLHTDGSPRGPKASLQCVAGDPAPELPDEDRPFLLVTGRTLYQFNAGTMTGRTPNARLRPSDALDMAPADAARLGLREGERVRVRSRYGDAVLHLRLDPGVKPGELFATFHDAEVCLNNLTSPRRDAMVKTPEYKVVAVNVSRAAAAETIGSNIDN